jgi:excinuclease UvrABC nuclease subunit
MSHIPSAAGVYAWYKDGRRVYIGKAKNLQKRVGSNHLGRGMSLTGSAFRRNVAEHLGLGTATEIKKRRRVLSTTEIALGCKWISECEVTWIVCGSDSDALAKEKAMKAEFKPLLTKR